jgi:hypothetical protein
MYTSGGFCVAFKKCFWRALRDIAREGLYVCTMLPCMLYVVCVCVCTLLPLYDALVYAPVQVCGC